MNQAQFITAVRQACPQAADRLKELIDGPDADVKTLGPDQILFLLFPWHTTSPGYDFWYDVWEALGATFADKDGIKDEISQIRLWVSSNQK